MRTYETKTGLSGRVTRKLKNAQFTLKNNGKGALSIRAFDMTAGVKGPLRSDKAGYAFGTPGTNIRLTTQEARALQLFLNANLPSN